MSLEKLPPDNSKRQVMLRPWPHRLWQEFPDWVKIGIAGFFFLFLIQVGIAIRIWYGLQDPPEVAAIRAPGRHIIIPDTNRDFRNPLSWLEAIPIGLRGTSAKDVTAVRLDEQTTDELVAYVAKSFPNLKSLYFSRGKISSQGLLALKNCPLITDLDVSDTDVDDGLSELLPHWPQLKTLILMNTDVGDAFTVAAAKHAELEYCAADGTNITPEAVAVWQAARPTIRIQTDFNRVALRVVIRWSDGKTSRRFSGQYEQGRYGPQLADGSGNWSSSMTTKSTGLSANQLRWPPQEFRNQADGHYQFRLTLNGIEAQPAEFDIKDGVPIPNRLEFQMPVTRSEAEQKSIKNQSQ